jgi:DNA-binding transcriptional ArsR family regulator
VPVATIASMPKRNGQGIDLLADPTRRAIVGLLAIGVGSPSKIAREIGRSRPATTRQLRLLQNARLVSVSRDYVDGRRRLYYIDRYRLGHITAWLAGTGAGRAFANSLRDEGRDPRDSSA